MTDCAIDLRLANEALYRRMLDAQNAGDHATWLACFTDDVVFEAPYYESAGPIAVGLTALSAVFERLNQIFASLDYQILRIIPASDPNLVIAEVAGDNLVKATGSRYRNRYLFLVTCRSGRISSIFEYSDPTCYSRAVASDS